MRQEIGKVFLGPFVIPVFVTDELPEDQAGEFTGDKEILLERGMRRDVYNQVLTHELVHGMALVAGEDWSEATVDRLACVLCSTEGWKPVPEFDRYCGASTQLAQQTAKFTQYDKDYKLERL